MVLKLRINDPAFAFGAQPFHKEDVLYEKMLKPLERGGIARGWLRFVVKGVSPEVLLAPGSNITISFCDVHDNKYDALHVMKAPGSEPILYFPGASQPFIQNESGSY